jgi:hypothetical protein
MDARIRRLSFRCLLWIGVAGLAAGNAQGAHSPGELARSELNRLRNFVPTVSTDGSYATRFVPHVHATTPWGENEIFELEVPEFIWATIEGDAHNDSPFFYGRAHTANHKERYGWVIRYAPQGRPAWVQKGKDLELTSELEGGFTVYFKVIPGPNHLELQSGVRNGSAKALTKVRFVNCAGTNLAPSMFVQHPRYSKLYAGDRVISWDGAGQSLDWLKSFEKDGGKFSTSIWFRAYLREFAPPDWERMEKLQEGRKFFLDQFIDVPAIAKANRDHTRHLVVYSPQGREAFTNLNTPCFHGNTDLDIIEPGETRWTQTHYTFFEGDIGRYFEELKKIHQTARTRAAK